MLLALPLPLLLLLLLVQALTARAAPRPSSSDDKEPLLIIARQACSANNPALFSQSLLDTYLSEHDPSQVLPRPFRLLSYEDTCGPDWQRAIISNALRSAGRGGSLVCAGRTGARVCGAVSPALHALGRPPPAACEEPQARGTAVAHIAITLEWRRVLLVTSSGLDECESALLEVQESLFAAGILVKIVLPQFVKDSFSIRPHALILCGSAMTAAILSININKAHILLLNIIDPVAENFIKYNETQTRTQTVEHSSGNGTECKRCPDDTKDQKIDEVNEVIKEDVRTDDNLLLMLSDSIDEASSVTDDNYYKIIQALAFYIDTERTRMETHRHVFNLYSSTTIDTNIVWNHIATVTAKTDRSLDNYLSYITQVSIDYTGELELKQWTLTGTSEEIVDVKVPSGTDAALHITVFTLFVTCTLILLLTFLATCARRAFARHIPKRPRAVPVLVSTDFQFPADEGRRVGEGMETMLSWLQQLHEFGGSEPERPDLLKRPEPLGQSAPSSTCSVTRLPLLPLPQSD